MSEMYEASRAWLAENAGGAAAAIVFFVAAWIVSAWVKRLVVRALEPTNVDVTLAKFFASSARWMILVLAVLGALSLLGLETTSYAALIAAFGVAFGLAFQGTLNNFASGLMLLVLRPFKVDDTVRAAGEVGVVDEVALFSTRLDTFDNRRIVIPNSAVFGTTIENLTYHDTRRVDVSIGVDYRADIDETRRILERAAAAVPEGIRDPAPQVVLAGLGDSAVDWEIRVWAGRGEFLTVKQGILRTVKLALDEAGISIPFPQMDVTLARDRRRNS